MIATVILTVSILILVAALIRALVTGKIEFDAAGSGMSASRSKDPVSFWTFFSLGVAAIAYLTWLLIP